MFSTIVSIKINVPIVDVKNNQTLAQAGINNNDTLLIYSGDYIHSGEGSFVFEPITETAMGDLSHQESRSPMRLPRSKSVLDRIGIKIDLSSHFCRCYWDLFEICFHYHPFILHFA
jgi:hypothetical protein